MKYGVGFLLYGLLDVIVDDYFAVLSELDDFYERVSDGSSPRSRWSRPDSGTGSRCVRRWLPSTVGWCRCGRR